MIITIHIDTEQTDHLKNDLAVELSRLFDSLESFNDTHPELLQEGYILNLYDSYHDLCGWLVIGG